MFEAESLGFLPFLDPSKPLLNSVNLIEVLASVDGQKDFERALDLLEFSLLKDFGVTHITLLAPALNQFNCGDWISCYQSSSAVEGQEGIVLSINAGHKIREIASSGVVSRATTNGDYSMYVGDSDDLKTVETHEIICVPLLHNLEAKGALVILREREKEFSESDLSHLSGVQSIFSHFYFKHRPDLTPFSGLATSAQETFEGIGFSKLQKTIALHLLQGKTDKQIASHLEVAEGKLHEEIQSISEILFVQSRNEIIKELSVLNLK